tara:strand:- start:8441 stop:9196 length:756 start_codon:yes stop_codon:yes gene_type:complete
VSSITESAICLRCWDYSETSQTVSLLTRGRGMLRGIAKGAKRPRSAFSGGFDPLTSGQLVAIVKPGRELALLTAWHLQEVHRALRQNLAANRAALYMADLTHRMLTDQDPHPEVFDALSAALQRCGLAGESARALLVFQWQILEACGYRPELQHDVLTGDPLDESLEAVGFSPIHGGTVADTGEQDRWRVRPATITLLRSLASGSAVEDADSVDRANRLLACYTRELLGDEPPAMRWAFPDLAPAARFPSS